MQNTLLITLIFIFLSISIINSHSIVAMPVHGDRTKSYTLDESGYVRHYSTILGQIDSNGYVRNLDGRIVGQIDWIDYIRDADGAIIGRIDTPYLRNSDYAIIAHYESGLLRDERGRIIATDVENIKVAVFLIFFHN